VAEVQPDLSVRATAKVVGDVPATARLPDMVNVNNKGRCAITLDPKDKFPGQQPYQGVVPLFGDQHEKLGKLSEVLEHYMLQSEQLDTRLILAADDKVAAGLLIQRLPTQGEKNIGSAGDDIGLIEDYNRIAILAATLTREELLTLDVGTILHRLFWEEKVIRFEPQTPRFACTCSRERVGNMIRSLGAAEAEGILAERGEIEVGCDFCGQQYRFDAVDAAQIFTSPGDQPPVTKAVQ
jgi:molecular chaperone Hsp33